MTPQQIQKIEDKIILKVRHFGGGEVLWKEVIKPHLLNQESEKEQYTPSELAKKILGEWNNEFSAKSWEERSLAAMEEYASQWKKRCEAAFGVIAELCELKAHKEILGKDATYTKRQPEAWQKANEFLREYCLSSLKEESTTDK